MSEKKGPDDGFMHNKVIAHRGAWKNQGVSENSISSLKNAIRLGCEGSEFDVWMSADSGLIISHDPVIGGKTIESTPAAELHKISLLNNDHVPSLKEYLDIIKSQHRTKLFLEIKSSLISQERSLALTERVVHAVHAAGARDWVSYISFNLGVLSRIKELDPEAETAYLSGDRTVEALVSKGMTGLDYPFYSFHSDTAITRNAHRAGLNVNAWTVDNKEEMRFLLQQGVDRITTNEPELLLEMLRKP
jgi:glycerophosphoryl diester phosphodiesterase